jgi:hypothetical protein
MRLPLLLIAAILSPSCKKGDDNPTEDITQPQQVEADSNSDGIMRVEVEFKDENLLVRIQDKPTTGEMICELNGQKLDKCEDGMLISKPQTGSYRLRVRVQDKDQLISVGETRFQTGDVPTPTVSDEPDPDAKDPLALEIANSEYVNGSAISIDKDLVLQFKFRNNPGCKPVLRCSFDKLDSGFAPLCNQAMGHKFSAGNLARGLQYFSVRASCEQRQGPELIGYWYGVPSDYQPLQIESSLVGTDNHVFRLVKANDCPENLLKFQCAETTGAEFTSCSGSRKSPKPGLRVRANCNGQAGPALTIRTS